VFLIVVVVVVLLLPTTTTFHYISFRTFLSKGWEGGLKFISWQVAKLDLLVGCQGFDGFGPSFLWNFLGALLH
jgi:hypothetical protein